MLIEWQTTISGDNFSNPIQPVMKRMIAVCLAKLSILSVAIGQTAAIKGKITDTLEKKQVEHVVIALIRTSDSVLINFTRSKTDGSFVLSPVPSGHFTLLVLHPKYADYIEPITVDKKNSHIELSNICLTPRMQLLQEVIVRHKIAPIRIKGDTTEYLADSFKLQANASVEDLLRILPGIQVDRKGQITAQGKKVEKVLVDGEEFFSEAPTVATQNLRADMVDKVQVFDKKSKQAEFTGMDDGARTKTINLKIKEDKKKSYFGKVEIGSDMDKYYDGSAMFFSFKGNRKFTAGVGTNNRSTGSAGGGSGEASLSGDVGTGILINKNAGGHYSNTWSDGDHHFSTNFMYNKWNVRPAGSMTVQDILPGTVYLRRQQSSAVSESERFELPPTYDLRIDSSSSLQVTTNASLQRSQNKSDFASANYLNDRLVSSSERSTTESSRNKQFSANLLYQKKIKENRSFSAQLQVNTGNAAMEGFLYAINQFYNSNDSSGTLDTTDQRKAYNNNRLLLSGDFNYTQLIAKNILMGIHYQVSSNGRSSAQQTFVKKGEKYETLIDSLSNEYNFRVISHTGGISWQIKAKKTQYTLGCELGYADYGQKDLGAHSRYSTHYINLFPRVGMIYRITSYKQVNIGYNGSTQPPALKDVQPIANNNDPLNIYIGNPGLKPAFKHNISLEFSSIKPLTAKFFNAAASLTATGRDFSNSSLIDSLGRKVNQVINVSGNYAGNATISYNIPLGPLNGNVSGGVTLSRQASMVNLLKNNTRSVNYNVQAGVRWNVVDRVYFSIQSAYAINEARSSLYKAWSTRFWTQDHTVETTVYLPWKLEVSTDASVSVRQKTAVFDKNNNVIRWNAVLTKKIAKGSWVIRAAVYDILNQNKGFSRLISGNQIIERNEMILQRYGLITIAWNLNKNMKLGIPGL